MILLEFKKRRGSNHIEHKIINGYNFIHVLLSMVGVNYINIMKLILLIVIKKYNNVYKNCPMELDIDKVNNLFYNNILQQIIH
tara:strand:- start:163 stop:411 length:249 start_codon:yes stop_codon:yes gene_type:complete